MYRKISEIDPEVLEELRSFVPDWKLVERPDRKYYQAPAPAHPVTKGARCAWLIRVPPGGKVHKHTDSRGETHTYVLKTNPDAPVTVEGIEYHLEEGAVYTFDRYLEHWSENRGSTDRINLLVEYA